MQPSSVTVQSVKTYPSINGSYLVLELTNLCNLKCVHCAVSETGHAHHASTGYLDKTLVEALIEDMVSQQLQIDVLILFWLGEPLMHPDFEWIYRRFIRAMRDYKIFKSIEVHSNAILLNGGKRRLFLNALPVSQRLHCTIDAYTSEVYTEVKGRDVIAQVQQNVEALLLAKRNLKVQNPRIVLQYIVGSNNVQDIPAFLNHWTGYFAQIGLPMFISAGQVPSGDLDGLFFRQLDCPTEVEQRRETTVFLDAMRALGISFPQGAPVVEQDSPLSMKHAARFEDNRLQPCSGFWKSPTIDWRGNLTSCTRDNLLENSLGNIGKSSFSSLWWGPKQTRNRLKVGCGEYQDLTLCQTCFIPKSCNHTEISSEEIQAYHASLPVGQRDEVFK